MFPNRVGLSGLISLYIGICLAMNSVVSTATGQRFGCMMAMYLARLRGIPKELREAAHMFAQPSSPRFFCRLSGQLYFSWTSIFITVGPVGGIPPWMT